jgi:hypothetical protein
MSSLTPLTPDARQLNRMCLRVTRGPVTTATRRAPVLHYSSRYDCPSASGLRSSARHRARQMAGARSGLCRSEMLVLGTLSVRRKGRPAVQPCDRSCVSGSYASQLSRTSISAVEPVPGLVTLIQILIAPRSKRMSIMKFLAWNLYRRGLLIGADEVEARSRPVCSTELTQPFSLHVTAGSVGDRTTGTTGELPNGFIMSVSDGRGHTTSVEFVGASGCSSADPFARRRDHDRNPRPG